jgi:ABC-type sugar transport system ATPase subunit
VVVISHNLANVFEVADRIIVRPGRRIASYEIVQDDARRWSRRSPEPRNTLSGRSA